MINRNQLPFILLSICLSIVLTTACNTQSADTDILETTWQWMSLSETEPASQSVVPDPENYTLMLNVDGTVNIKADCNLVSGSYMLEDDFLAIELGPSTMAFCGEQSLDLIFLEMLNSIERYTIENDQLVLHLENDAGRMMFAK